MQFVTNGPDIPDSLLFAHEENRVVFFCGAGISYKVGLKDFKWLVDEIYRLCGTPRKEIEDRAYLKCQYDTTLNLLEDRLPGQRAGLEMRSALASALKPNLRRKGATDTHAALLKLARNRKGTLRLVTTNFDRTFENVARRAKYQYSSYAAPMLPIPKNSQWNGVVYLHGLLPNLKEDRKALDRLVVTSGDFGLAYLTERWAARFVSELFRNYVVCFVGYSIDDPVLRYMMDALAADRLRGEVTQRAYAFGACEPGGEESALDDWTSKGVTPILYDSSDNHTLLHNTLKVWAEDYQNGVRGKERVVVEHAIANPTGSTKQDDFVGRMLWALADKSGLPAQRFADFDPVPPLTWLVETFSENRFQQSDLARFRVPPLTEIDDKLRFSLVHRPAPYDLSPWMSLAPRGAADSQWDKVMFQLARWLVRHLNDPKLIIWLAQRGGRLTDRWRWLIEDKLKTFAELKQNGNTTDLEKIQTNAPMAIPSPMMQTLWRLMLSGRVKSPWRELDLYAWKVRFKRDGLTATLRLELRELLAPKVKLKELFRWSVDDESAEEITSIKQLVDWELVLASDHVQSSLRDLSDECWRTALPALLDDLQQLLRDALDLLHELGEADDRKDRSYWDLPSISPHWQNRDFRDWVTLIALVRDAWLATRETDPGRATKIAQNWFDLPYPTFKRLALFAASHDGCITGDQWVEWLSADEAWWLWSLETQRETMRLLVIQTASLLPEARAKLETTVLAGPPRKMYKDDLDLESWQSLVDRSIWLHLAKLNEGGRKLDGAPLQIFERLSTANPDWKLASNERDEFSHWMTGTGDPDYEEERQAKFSAPKPRKCTEWLTWLQQDHGNSDSYDLDEIWRDGCRRHALNTWAALRELAQQSIWPLDRWRVAFQAWSESGRVRRSWRFAAPLVQTMPDTVMQDITHSVTWWMDAASKAIDCHEAILLDLCKRVLSMHLNPATGILQNGKPINQPVTEAINHPVGHVTQALLNLWLKREPNDNESLPIDIEPFFTTLCDVGVEKFRHGRVLLASRLIALFRVDRSWTETHLLPLFDWTHSVEAKAAWEGFLWSPRLYRPLLIAFKSQFLSTAHHYTDIGEHSRQFAAFLTYAALDSVDGYTAAEFQSAVGVLPQEGLQEVAQALSQALEGAGEQREEYWKNRVQPFWHLIWPKSVNRASQNIAESLTRLCIAARGEFPAALVAVVNWLQPLEHPDSICRLLQKSGLAGRFPEDALSLLRSIHDEQSFVFNELPRCLETIALANPSLSGDPRYQYLLELVHKRGA